MGTELRAILVGPDRVCSRKWHSRRRHPRERNGTCAESQALVQSPKGVYALNSLFAGPLRRRDPVGLRDERPKYLIETRAGTATSAA